MFLVILNKIFRLHRHLTQPLSLSLAYMYSLMKLHCAKVIYTEDVNYYVIENCVKHLQSALEYIEVVKKLKRLKVEQLKNN